MTEAELIMEIEPNAPNAPKPTKPKKARKPMSEAHKEKLIKSLVKAREQSAIKRGLKSHAKKILKEKEDAETNKIVRQSLLSKLKNNDEEDPRDIEIKQLRKKLDGLTLQQIIPKPKPKPKPKPIPEEEEFMPIDEPDEPIILHLPLLKVPEPIPIPVPEPIPEPAPKLTRVLRKKRRY
tara:strand:+ start:943 stop:1479 length:537 start_codon:yes stop_codon:yes gene_type:complete